MNPFTSFNLAHSRLVHIKNLGDSPLAHAFTRKHFLNFGHLFRTKKKGIIRPAFIDTILDVVTLGSLKQVTRINTRRIVASMEYPEIMSDKTVNQLPHVTRSEPRSPLSVFPYKGKSPVPVFVGTSSPQPATFGLANEGPKSHLLSYRSQLVLAIPGTAYPFGVFGGFNAVWNRLDIISAKRTLNEHLKTFLFGAWGSVVNAIRLPSCFDLLKTLTMEAS